MGIRSLRRSFAGRVIHRSQATAKANNWRSVGRSIDAGWPGPAGPPRRHCRRPLLHRRAPVGPSNTGTSSACGRRPLRDRARVPYIVVWHMGHTVGSQRSGAPVRTLCFRFLIGLSADANTTVSSERRSNFDSNIAKPA